MSRTGISSLRHRFLRRFCSWAILYAVAFLPLAEATDDSNPAHALLLQYYGELERRNLPIIVAVASNEGPVSVREFGVLQDDGVSAATTQVDLLSITKSVTAVSILKLVDLGKANLADTLGLILPDVPADRSGITIHQLLTHSSGIINSCGDDHDQLSRSGLLTCAFDAELIALPGTRYQYSNAGYSILAAIVGDISGKSFESFLQEDVLSGTELTSIGYAAAYENSRSMRAIDGQSIADASWGGSSPYWNLVGTGVSYPLRGNLYDSARHWPRD